VPRAALALLAVLGAALALAAVLPPPVGRAEDGPPVDYEFFKARVSPVLMEHCASCHADPRKRSKMGRFFLRPAPGRRVRDRHHEDNFETALRFLEAGNPAASPLLLKAIGPRFGGVTHEGGGIFTDNQPEYGTLIDWINGARLPQSAWRPPVTPDGQPDFLYYLKHVEPVLQSVCSECHRGRGQGRMKVLTAEGDAALPLEDVHANYQTVMRLVSPSRPERSRFLLKPLAEADGGIAHKGGDVIRAGDVNHVRWLEFLQGVRGPPLATGVRRAVPVLTAQGLALEAEDLTLEGALAEVDDKHARLYLAVEATEEGGALDVELEVQDAGPYRIVVRAVPGPEPLELEMQDGPVWPIGPTGEPADPPAYVDLEPRSLLDRKEPLRTPRGDLRLEGDVLAMDGRLETAAWLSPAQVRHSGASLRVRLPPEEEGGDDVWLLFDMADPDNGKFAGLGDGGRRFLLGVLEGGRPRVLGQAQAPDPPPEAAGEPREIRVEYYAGVVVASLDGRALLHVNLDRSLGEGAFGALAHGRAFVHGLSALEQYEVYGVRLATGGVVDLPAGPVRLTLRVPPQGGRVDAIDIRAP
jgi:hypothetical protein